MKKWSLLLWASIAWLIFVVALATWWMIFSLRMLMQLQDYIGEGSFRKQHDMLLMEGSVLILFLLVGGSFLIYFVIREKSRFDQVRLFFTTFTHDMKTSITRLLLQSEELTKKSSPEAVKAFQRNILGLEFQLENSLNMAQFNHRPVHLEKVELKSLVLRLHQYWPNIKITLNASGPIITDATGLESILRNVITNAMTHARADEFRIKLDVERDYKIVITDNGAPSSFEFSRAGYTINPTASGTGIGLFLIRQWAEKLGGRVSFVSEPQGSIKVELALPRKREAT